MIKRISKLYRSIEEEHGLLPDLNPYEGNGFGNELFIPSNNFF